MVRVDVQFRGSVEAYFRSEAEISSTRLKEMLDDAIDAVAAARLAAFMDPETPYNAVVHTDGLRIVDILADEGIWVCLGEGCNSNCHGMALGGEKM